jgi:outer membrane protein assembly factor BamB
MSSTTKKRFWKNLAIVSSIFTFVICALVLLNYIQMNRLDPVNSELINSLVQRLEENPNDAALRDQIREMDLLARKAYFTTQWQIKMGSYLLILGLIVSILSFQVLQAGRQKFESSEQEEDIVGFKKKARRWIATGGISLVVISLLVAYSTHEDLNDRFTQAAEKQIVKQEAQETPAVEEINTVIEEEKKEEVKVAPVVQAEKKKEIVPEKKEAEKQVRPVEEKKKIVQKEETVPKETAPKPKKEEKTEAANYPTKEMMANFPSFRGAAGMGIAYQKNLPVEWDGASGKNVLWKQKVPLHAYNSPVIWGDKLFLSGANADKREVYCYDKNSGQLLWTAQVAQIPNSPAKSPDVTPDTGHAASSVTCDGKAVYAIFANGDVVAIDLNGKQIWGKNLGTPSNHYGHSSSLLVYQDQLIIQFDQKKKAKVISLSTSDGKEKWSTKRKVKVSWSSPVIANLNGKDQLILAADPSVAAYDLQDGKELWKVDCISGEVGPSVAVANGLVFALNEYASLVAIKPGDSPEIVWEAYDYLSDVPSPVASGDHLFIVTSYGAVVCYDSKSGEIKWEKEFENGFYSSPILAEGKVYLIDRKGVMHIFKAASEYQEVGTCALGEISDMTPAFSEGRIYIRGEKNLYCIGK